MPRCSVRSRRGSRGPAIGGLLAACLGAAAGCGGHEPPAGADPLADVPTYADGRLPVGELYGAYRRLLALGWSLDIVVMSEPAGSAAALPIVALRSPRTGPGLWLLAGIHGEEPAGPNAIAAAMDDIARLGERYPVVLLPLLNPQGYVRNWRYLNVPVYSEAVDGQSVGDSSHLLADPSDPTVARAAGPSSPEAGAITDYVLRWVTSYPPRYSIDLHEDNLIDEGYVYSQGALGAADPLALEAVAILREGGIPQKANGETRFGEPVVDGIIGPVNDSSIDELMSATTVLVGGAARPGPAAGTVLVFETPAAAVGFDRRVEAHLALLRRLVATIAADSAPAP